MDSVAATPTNGSSGLPEALKRYYSLRSQCRASMVSNYPLSVLWRIGGLAQASPSNRFFITDLQEDFLGETPASPGL